MMCEGTWVQHAQDAEISAIGNFNMLVYISKLLLLYQDSHHQYECNNDCCLRTIKNITQQGLQKAC